MNKRQFQNREECKKLMEQTIKTDLLIGLYSPKKNQPGFNALGKGKFFFNTRLNSYIFVQNGIRKIISLFDIVSVKEENGKPIFVIVK